MVCSFQSITSISQNHLLISAPDLSKRVWNDIVAVTVNSATILLYWQIGNRIRKDVLGEEQAEYGKRIVASLSRKLVKEYGEGLSPKNLSRMTRFCWGISQDEDCAHTECTIELDTYSSDHLSRWSIEASVVCRNESYRAMEYPHTGTDDCRHALRAHCHLEETR